MNVYGVRFVTDKQFIADALTWATTMAEARRIAGRELILDRPYGYAHLGYGRVIAYTIREDAYPPPGPTCPLSGRPCTATEYTMPHIRYEQRQGRRTKVIGLSRARRFKRWCSLSWAKAAIEEYEEAQREEYWE